MKNLHEEMGNSEETTMEMVEIRDTISRKNFIDSVLHRTEEEITEPDDRSIEIIQ